VWCVALNGYPLQSYRASPAIWEQQCYVSPDTGKCTHFNPSRRARYLIMLITGGGAYIFTIYHLLQLDKPGALLLFKFFSLFHFPLLFRATQQTKTKDGWRTTLTWKDQISVRSVEGFWTEGHFIVYKKYFRLWSI